MANFTATDLDEIVKNAHSRLDVAAQIIKSAMGPDFLADEVGQQADPEPTIAATEEAVAVTEETPVNPEISVPVAAEVQPPAQEAQAAPEAPAQAAPTNEQPS